MKGSSISPATKRYIILVDLILGTFLNLLFLAPGLFIAIGHDSGAPSECVATSPPPPSTVTCGTRPNHPPLYFWGVPNAAVTLASVQGSGQRSNPNFAGKNSGANTGNVALHGGTTYCTGVTSVALTTTTTDTLEFLGSINLVSSNVTGAVITLATRLGGNGVVPATVFQSGNCASLTGATSITTSTTVDDTSHQFGGTMVISVSRAAGTYYTWVEVIPSVNILANILGGTGGYARTWDTTADQVLASGSPSASTSLSTWPLFPSALTEAPTTQAFRLADKLQSQTSQARLSIRIVASAVFGGIVDTTARVWSQYSTDSGVTWHDLCGDGTQTPNIDVTQAPSTTPYSSAFCTIQTGAFTTILLRIVGDGGDDGTTFQASLITLELSP